MNIIDISFDSVCYITIQLNWLAILVLGVAVIGINYLIKKLLPSQENTLSPSKR